MRDSEYQDSGNLSAFLAGALVGAGVALLFAPQTGSRMRGMLRDYAARAKDELDGAVEQGSEAWDRAVEGGQRFVQKGQDTVRRAGRQAKDFVESAREEVEKAVEGVTQDTSRRQR
ncbi:MAG: YtxH domain-containing protein [Nitrospiraceae bacterium]|nr:YtxH domain-containing protein [Nitrospiraceae bacterium]